MHIQPGWDSAEQNLPQYYFSDIPEDEQDGEPEGKQPFVAWPRDPTIDPAKEDLKKWFEVHPASVFYGRQIEVIFEKKYFHWITHKALRELMRDGSIASDLRVTKNGNRVRLYWSKQYRYPKRAAERLALEVDEHSNPDVTRAIGHHAETLFGFAASRLGFSLAGPNVNSYEGKIWKMTEHDLDWIFERDGVGWGVEIKNTWAYIDRDEMNTKISLCQHLGLRPLFIMRWAPKSYIESIRQRNGFALLYEHQYFPPGYSTAVEGLKSLFLPVVVAPGLPVGVLERFVVNGHERVVKM